MEISHFHIFGSLHFVAPGGRWKKRIFVADEMINTPASEIISSATKEDSLLPSYPDGASRLGELSEIRRYPLT